VSMQSMAAHKRGVDSPTPRLGINQTISTYCRSIKL